MAFPYNPSVLVSRRRIETHPLVAHNNCYCNLTCAIAPFGVVAADIQYNIELFMKFFVDYSS